MRKLIIFTCLSVLGSFLHAQTFTVNQSGGNSYMGGAGTPNGATNGSFTRALIEANNGNIDSIVFAVASIDLGGNQQILTGAGGVTISAKTTDCKPGVIITNGPGGGPGLRVRSGNNIIEGINFRIGVVLETTNSTGNIVRTNYFNTSLDGTTSVPGNFANFCISIDNADGNTIGGPDHCDLNLITHANQKIHIRNGSDNNVIEGNIIGGLAIDGVTMLAESIEMSGNGFPENHGIYVEGGVNGGDLGGTGTIIRRNIISNNRGGHGIRINKSSPANAGRHNGSLIVGNYIGVDSSGTIGRGNWGGGIKIEGGHLDYGGSVTTGHIIGGVNPEDRNIISDNGNGLDVNGDGVTYRTTANGYTSVAGHGIELLFTESSTILGNYIGTDVTGNSPMGNHMNGVYLQISSNNTVGGTVSGARNIVGANGYAFEAVQDPDGGFTFKRHGIQLDGNQYNSQNYDAENNIIKGNWVGVGEDGVTPLGNAEDGISIYRFSNENIIGGPTDAEKNITVYNHEGIFIQLNSKSNVVQGNWVGLLPDGVTAVGNTDVGIKVQGQSNLNVIGGANAGEGNIIVGHPSHGILSTSDPNGPDGGQGPAEQNIFYGNIIGDTTLANSNPTFANGGDGIHIREQSQGNIIGGPLDGQGNIIGNNAGNAVFLLESTSFENKIVGNTMICNGIRGIELNGAANETATLGQIQINISDQDPTVLKGFAAGYPRAVANGGPSVVHFYRIRTECGYDQCHPNVEGYELLDSVPVTSGSLPQGAGTGGVWEWTLPTGVAKDEVTATVTDAAGNTSEFASCTEVCNPPGTVTLTVDENAICADGSAEFTATASGTEPTGGFEYEFFRAPSTSVQGPSSTNTFSTAIAGDYYVIVTDPADPSNCSVQSTGNVTLTVNPNPVITSATNNGPVCEGETITLFAQSDIAATFSWNGGAYVGANPTVTTNAILSDAGTYTVTATATGTGCPSTSTEQTVVVVNENPELNYTGNLSEEICEGDDISFTVTADAGGVVQWTLPNPPNVTGSTVNITDAVLADAGTYTAIATNPSTGCTTESGNEVVITLVVNENPELNYTGNLSEEVCEGDDISFTVTADAGGVVEWTLPNPPNVTGNTVSITDAVLADAGTYTATASNPTTGCSNVLGDEVVITLGVNENPELTYTGDFNPEVCEEDDISFTLTADAGGVVEWTLPNPPNVTGNTVNVTDATLADAGTYTAIATNPSTGCSTASGNEVVITLDVNVLPTPAFSVSNNGPACNASGVEYQVSGGLLGSTYSWTVPAGASIQGAPDTDNQIFVDFGTNNGFVRVTETSVDNCATTIEEQITLIGCSLVADFEANRTEVCVGETVTFTDLTTGTPDGWTWDFGADATPATSNVQGPINVTYSTPGQKTISLIATEGPASDDEIKTAYITVNELPTLTDIDITDAGEICEGESVTLTANPVNANSDYTWTIPSGAVLTSGQLSGPGSSAITVQFPTASVAGDVTLTETTENGCSDGNTETQPVVVNENPELNYTGNLSEEVCEGDDISFTVTADAGGVVEWTLPNPPNVTGNTVDVVSATLADAGTYTATASNPTTGCSNVSGDEVVITLAVNENPELNYTGNLSEEICEGDDISFTVTADAGGVVEWTLPDASTFAGNTINITDAVLAYAGTYTATASNPTTGCSNVSGDEIVITLGVNENPELTYTGDLSPEVCEGDNISFTVTADAGGIVEWELPGGGTSANPVNVIGATLADAGIYRAIAVNPGTMCETAAGSEVEVDLTVNPAPSALTINGDFTPACESKGEGYNVTGGTAGSTFDWQAYTGATIISGTVGPNNTSIVVDFTTTSGSISVQETTAEGCVGTRVSESISLLSCGLTAAINAGPYFVCVGDSLEISSTSQGTGATTVYSWDFGGGPAGSGVTPQSSDQEGPHWVKFDEVGNVNVTLRIEENGVVDDTTITVEVYDLPSPQIVGSDVVCKDADSVYAVLNPAAFSTYDWFVSGNGTFPGDNMTTQGTSVTVEFEDGDTTWLYVQETDPTTGCVGLSDSTIIVTDTLQAVAGSDIVLDDLQEIDLIGDQSVTGIDMVFPNDRFHPIEWTSSVDDTEISNPTVDNTKARPTESPTYYSLEVTNPMTGCVSIDSFAVSIDYELIIPTGFTPNNDGENDVWEIWNIDRFPDNKVEIYNRWGSLVWESSDYSNNDGWSGLNLNGTELPIGTYFYVVTINGDEDKEPYSGPVTIIK